jgi:phosphoribosyl-AMP cyclohydrolase
MSSSRSAPSGQPEPFEPKFDAQGLIPAVAVDAGNGEVLMTAYMNREALDATRKTQKATFYSRSRKKLWVKGETSGNFLAVEEIRVDCDQDCVVLRV